MNEIILRYEPGNEWLAHHGILGQKWGSLTKMSLNLNERKRK